MRVKRISLESVFSAIVPESIPYHITTCDKKLISCINKEYRQIST